MWDLNAIRVWWVNDCPQASPKAIDKWIEPLIRFLNTMPGCATICSCAGAGPHGRGKKWHTKEDTPYIFMVCRDPRSMALLLMALKGVRGKIILKAPRSEKGLHTFADLSGESTITFHFKDYQQLKLFERRLYEVVQIFEKDGEVFVDH